MRWACSNAKWRKRRPAVWARDRRVHGHPFAENPAADDRKKLNAVGLNPVFIMLCRPRLPTALRFALSATRMTKPPEPLGAQSCGELPGPTRPGCLLANLNAAILYATLPKARICLEYQSTSTRHSHSRASTNGSRDQRDRRRAAGFQNYPTTTNHPAAVSEAGPLTVRIAYNLFTAKAQAGKRTNFLPGPRTSTYKQATTTSATDVGPSRCCVLAAGLRRLPPSAPGDGPEWRGETLGVAGGLPNLWPSRMQCTTTITITARWDAFER